MRHTVSLSAGHDDVGDTPEVEERVFVVDGLHCSSCAAAVQAQLRRQPGVVSAAVNFAADSAIVRWDDTRTPYAELQHAVSRLGYRLRSPDDADNAAENVDRIRKPLQWRFAVAVFFGMWSMMPALLIYLAPLGVVEPAVTWPLGIASGMLAIPVLLYSGMHFYCVGWRTLRVGAASLDTLISVAVMAACLVSVWHLVNGSAEVYFDAAVMLITFQLVARLIDSGVRRRASDIIRGYLTYTPDQVQVWRDDEWQEVAAKEVTAGEHIRLEDGEPLALDGYVIDGNGDVDMSILTGEHVSRRVARGEALEAGCRLVVGKLELSVTAGVGERRIDGIARSVRALLSHKTTMQRFADRLARLLLPLIMVASGFTMLLGMAQSLPTDEILLHGLAVLIIACPCALSLAIPLVVVLGHARMVALGILFRDPAALEGAASVSVIVFDKTGTLTTGTPHLSATAPVEGVRRNELLQLAADVMHGVPHPIAEGLATAAAPSSQANQGQRDNHPGQGVCWTHGIDRIVAGRRTWLIEQGIAVPVCDETGMELHVARNGRYAGRLLFRETLRPEALSTVRRLQQSGYSLYLLSGDTPHACQEVAETLGISYARALASRSPEEKSRFVEALERHHVVAFVGDGLNDGLALARARLGIAVGHATSAASQAGAVYLPDGLARIPQTLQMAKQARRLMKHNLCWAIGYNTIAIPLAIAGWVAPVVAALAMTLSSLCVLVNSLRIRSGKLSESVRPS
ncbi:cation-translocating P-type ATPase [Halomonas sp. 11-S5]|uniref:heavy metal translocating P-type ATPase n=1 Tax=Halomonas sp. 11-S5 TaxID=2994064 RepID=UPI0024693A44|nr:cation-translocating P-type ATPase [Halomonas sp. 11-S5]